MFDRIDKSYDKDSLQTPYYIYAWLNSIYKFDIDLAASKEHHLCLDYFTIEDDSTSIDWFLHGSSGFLNPPYSRGEIQPFIDQSLAQAKERFTTVMLIPELNGESRTKEILDNATNIYHFDKRIWFINPLTGEECKHNNRGSIVIEFSKKYVKTKPNHIFMELDEIKRQFKTVDKEKQHEQKLSFRSAILEQLTCSMCGTLVDTYADILYTKDDRVCTDCKKKQVDKELN